MSINKVNLLEVPRAELDSVLAVHEAAFGQEDEAELVGRLLDDPSARPCLSLGAYAGDRLVGHVLFTRASLPEPDCRAALLAPLAVVPDSQGQGIGGRLIEEGVRRLADAGVALVFVLGWPDYYQRHGFEPVGSRGFEAPYPLLPAQADAWMMRALVDGVAGRCRAGTVRCAEALNRPEYWIE